MLNDWSDRMTAREAADAWQQRLDEQAERRATQVEGELHDVVERAGTVPHGFYEAMRHFLSMRESLFPGLPADPAWKILLTLAQTGEGSGKASATGIAYGADVPLTTALRYIAMMETQGIVERAPHPDDKRQVVIRLTDEGRQRLDALARRWTTRLLWLALLPLTFVVLAWQGGASA